MSTRDGLNNCANTTPISNVPLPLPGTAQPALLKRVELARVLKTSVRTIDNLQRQKKIPFLRISRRCVRFDLPRVLAALQKFEIQEAGRR